MTQPDGGQRVDEQATDVGHDEAAALEQERNEALAALEDWLEAPMIVLAFVWLALLVAELLFGERRPFAVIGTVIWGIFIVDFGVKLLLAPRKLAYVRRNWLAAVSLLIPAFRLFRIAHVVRVLRLARVGRSLRLFRLVSSLNRGMRALGASLGRRGFGYVVALTALVTLAGAAGMLAFERDGAGGIDTFGEALWWTTMVMTTLGSGAWPVTFEGRILAVALALYAFGIFGYVTATLATYFVGRDAESAEAELAGAAELAAIRHELAALRAEVGSLVRSTADG